MALPASFLDELRARTPLAALIGRRVKLSKSGRQWKGCCPFHGEKTPSFYVYDDHFHCFGCGAHGDAVSFVMQSQGAAFIDAIETLAAEAGMDVPKTSPQAAEAERRRLDLHQVLEAAAGLFSRQLHAPEGGAALAYLRGRGLTDATIASFGLGWSGDGGGRFATAMTAEGAEAEVLAESGLLRPGSEGAFFFNRVMFPIRDRRGRVISFGGRVLGDGQPKYLNGPETSVFFKRRTLYGLDAARDGIRKGSELVVVEGYMDVIVLHQAGFTGAVAPLGTALTTEHLEELWRLSPAPILCFDGDAAGARAAARTANVALPLLAPDRSLRLARLPSGEDPDTLVRRNGAAAFNGVLAAAHPLSQALFDLVAEGADRATPEGRAALRSRLDGAAARIDNRALAAEYRRVLLDRYFAEFRTSRRPPNGRPTRTTAPAQPVDPTRPRTEQLRTLVAILLHHPRLLHDVEEAFCALVLPEPLDRLRAELLRWVETADLLDLQGLADHLAASGLSAEMQQVLSLAPFPLPACAAPEAMPAEAEAGWWCFYGLLHRDSLEAEVQAAHRALAEHFDEPAQRRVVALVTARARLSDDISDL